MNLTNASSARNTRQYISALAESCDEFIFYETLNGGLAKQVEEEHPKDKLSEQELQLMVETIEGMQKDRLGPVRPGTIKQSMLRKHPTFDEGEYGFSGLHGLSNQLNKRDL